MESFLDKLTNPITASTISGLVVFAATSLYLATKKVRRRNNPLAITEQVISKEPWEQVFSQPITQELVESTPAGMPAERSYEWFKEQGGSDHGSTRVRIRLQNKISETVDIKLVVSKNYLGSPLKQARVTHPTAGANAVPVLIFDLDSDKPEAWEGSLEFGVERTGHSPYFDRNLYSLSPGEIGEFIILGQAHVSHWEWGIEVIYRINNTEGIVRLDGKYRTSGSVETDEIREKWLYAWLEGGKLIPETEYI